ncbi:MAG: hypothetical protein OXT67_10130 [Zetaproteobacteria bacterium]|nr:hypothetical protein [Zetaproteobacteria bacterium]
MFKAKILGLFLLLGVVVGLKEGWSMDPTAPAPAGESAESVYEDARAFPLPHTQQLQRDLQVVFNRHLAERLEPEQAAVLTRDLATQMEVYVENALDYRHQQVRQQACQMARQLAAQQEQEGHTVTFSDYLGFACTTASAVCSTLQDVSGNEGWAQMLAQGFG